MTQQQQQQGDVLIKWSGDYWKYMIINGGFLRILATGLEDTLAATGRSLLLIFLLYCGVKSGALLVAPNWKPELWLEMLMFLLQLGGLEGSIPGLSRRADELRAKNDEVSKVGAKKIDDITKAARLMTIAAVAEGVLHIIFKDGTCPAFIFFGPTVPTMQLVSGVLLILRTFVILTFLVELGKVDAKGPRVMSKGDYEQERDRAEKARLAESEQGRMLASLRIQLDESRQALSASQQREQGQGRLVENLRTQLDQVQQQNQQAIEGLQQQYQLQMESQARIVDDLRDQLATMEQMKNAVVSSANDQTANIQALQNRVREAEHQVQLLQSTLTQKEQDLQTANVSLQTANNKVADLQNAVREASKSANTQPAKTPKSQPSPAANITPLRKANEGPGKPAKLTHEEVIAYMEAHSKLTRAEVAEQLNISERKVYDAVAWQKSQTANIVAAGQ